MKLVDSGTSFERFKVIRSDYPRDEYSFPPGLLLFHENGYRYLVGDHSYSNWEYGEHVYYNDYDIAQFIRWELYEY